MDAHSRSGRARPPRHAALRVGPSAAWEHARTRVVCIPPVRLQVGPRAAGAVAAACFSSGLVIGGLGVYLHQVPRARHRWGRRGAGAAPPCHHGVDGTPPRHHDDAAAAITPPPPPPPPHPTRAPRQLPLVYLGYGFLGGCGAGLSCARPPAPAGPGRPSRHRAAMG
jgi:hypothetical protein